jgi:hypothetical protein
MVSHEDISIALFTLQATFPARAGARDAEGDALGRATGDVCSDSNS